MSLPRVFVPQIVMRFNEAANRVEPVYDFTAATQFGAIVPILDESDDPMYLSRLIHKINKALADFSPEDYFIAVGDPAVIATCAGIILRRQASMRMLKWSRKLTVYTPLEIKP